MFGVIDNTADHTVVFSQGKPVNKLLVLQQVIEYAQMIPVNQSVVSKHNIIASTHNQSPENTWM